MTDREASSTAVPGAKAAAHRHVAGRAVRVLLPIAVVVVALVAAAGIKGLIGPRDTQVQGAGLPPGADPADWCAAHGVAESLCTRCHPELSKSLVWCAEHALPEALCPICNPDLADRFVLCEPHGLPASHCVRCDPSYAARVANAAPGESSTDLSSADRGDRELPMIRLAGPEIAVRAGIEVASVRSFEHVDTITCNAEADYNQNRFAQVLPRVEGVVREVRVDLGDDVRRGDVLAVVDSARLGDAKADYLAALELIALAEKSLGRIRELAARQIVPEKSRLEAETRFQEAEIRTARARQTLVNLGLADDELEQLVRDRDTGSLLAVVAPLDGTIVRRHAVEGEAVQGTTELFAVSDLRALWVYLDLYEKDLARVRVGQPVSFVVEAFSAGGFPGTVTWVSPEVDPRTRTIRARAEVKNEGGLLRAHMFGRWLIEVSDAHQSLVVPKEAVQTHEGAHVVFVRKSDSLFEPRRVEIGHQTDTLWEIARGLNGDEQVVTKGSFLFKTELMKGAIGGGCCAE